MPDNEDDRSDQGPSVKEELVAHLDVQRVIDSTDPPDPHGTPHYTKNDSGGRAGRTINFLKRLSLNEWLTFFVGFASLVVSCLTYRNAADTRDLQNAVGHLSTLADAAQKQVVALSLSNRQSREFFAAERAPVIWHENDMLIGGHDLPLLTLIKGAHAGVLAWNWHLKNFGAASALDATVKWTLTINGTACGSNGSPSAGEVIPPNTGLYTSAQCTLPVSASNYAALLRQSGSIVLREIVIYSDSFGSTFETDFCQFNDVSGAIAHCPGNEIHRIK